MIEVGGHSTSSRQWHRSLEVFGEDDNQQKPLGDFLPGSTRREISPFSPRDQLRAFRSRRGISRCKGRTEPLRAGRGKSLLPCRVRPPRPTSTVSQNGPSSELCGRGFRSTPCSLKQPPRE